MNNFNFKIIYILIIKRIFDILFALILLFVTLPILFFSILILIISNQSFNVFFIQSRPGKNERIFKVIKLKTMNNNIDSNGALLSDELRTTNFGKYLRKFSIDELPQLFNVIIGEMSIIGPRPLLVDYLTKYTHEQKRRHDVLPGITGWAQINGRNNINFNERFKLDVWYVDNISFFLDLNIFLKTILKIFKSENFLIQDPNKINDRN
jgi:undecaprenyl phosphate N,N'-diacetylbacillosamine 1-phosphate transferase